MPLLRAAFLFGLGSGVLGARPGQTAALVSQEGVPPAARVAAAGILLDRGWGKPQQDVTLDSEIRITIRKMLDDDDDEPVIIDVTPRMA
jgi:hypothetical protein